jgi:hypothetical protein
VGYEAHHVLKEQDGVHEVGTPFWRIRTGPHRPRHTETQTIDLDQPGAPEVLQQSNATHYEKVGQIVARIVSQPDAAVPGWMLANFNARGVNYAPIEMTSYPPKRRLSFALDDTRYSIVVTLTKDGRITPLK